jgi:hypothetical protein
MSNPTTNAADAGAADALGEVLSERERLRIQLALASPLSDRDAGEVWAIIRDLAQRLATLRRRLDMPDEDGGPPVSFAAIMDNVRDQMTGHTANKIEELVCYHIRRAERPQDASAVRGDCITQRDDEDGESHWLARCPTCCVLVSNGERCNCGLRWDISVAAIGTKDD